MRQRNTVTWLVALVSAAAFHRRLVSARPIAGRLRLGDRRGRSRPRRRRRSGPGRLRPPGHTPKSSPAAAKTDDGIFKVHRISEGNRDTLFYEIPKAEMDKDFLWNTQIKKTTIGAGYGGQNVGSRVVRWVLKGDNVLLQDMDYTLVADPSNPLKDEANLPAIIRTFPVEAVCAQWRSGHQRHRALHERRAGVLGARRRRRPWHGRDAGRSSRRPCRSPRTSTLRPPSTYTTTPRTGRGGGGCRRQGAAAARAVRAPRSSCTTA